MKLKVKLLDIQAGGKRIAILDDETASFLGAHSSDRLNIKFRNKNVVAIVNVAADFPRASIGVYEEVSKQLGLKDGENGEVQVAEAPEALRDIQAKIRGERLRNR